MGKTKDAPVSGALAAEVCQRTGSAAVIDGVIAQLGTHVARVAISPDEKRIAVGDRTGKVVVYDLTGNVSGVCPECGKAMAKSG